jgi:hypothetical protein
MPKQKASQERLEETITAALRDWRHFVPKTLALEP